MSVRLLALLALWVPTAHAQEDPLARELADFPRAAAERWGEWTPESAVPEALQEDLVRAARAYVEGRYQDTLEALYTVLDREPDYPPALHQSGVVHFRLRRYGTSRDFFERYLEVAPREIVGTRALAHCYYSLGQYDEALAHYERVLAEVPEEVEALRGCALARMRLGALDEALAQLRRVVELEPGHANAWTWIAQIHFDMDQLDEARAAAARARDLDPYEARPWFLLSQVLFELEEEEEGEEAYERFVELDRYTQELRALEGQLLYEPHDLARLSRLAEVHRLMGDRDGMREALARLVGAKPKDPEVRIYVLDMLLRAEDAEAAAVAAEAMALALPDEPEVWQRLERYYAQTRQRMKQVRAGERYLRLQAERDGGR